MTRKSKGRIYKGKGTKAKELKEFEKRYGKTKGKKVYGATVAKVWRERNPGKKSWNAGKHYHTK